MSCGLLIMVARRYNHYPILAFLLRQFQLVGSEYLFWAQARTDMRRYFYVSTSPPSHCRESHTARDRAHNFLMVEFVADPS